MKNTVRIHHKGGTKSPSLQTKTRRRSKLPPVRASFAWPSAITEAFTPTDGACILFHGGKEDSTLASVEISAEQLASMERAAAGSNISVGSFIQQGLNRLVAELTGRIDAHAKKSQPGIIPLQWKSGSSFMLFLL